MPMQPLALRLFLTPLPVQWRAFVKACRAETEMTAARRRFYVAAWFFIAAVSVYDSLLVVAYRGCILQMEMNPVGVYLIRLGGDDVSVFLRTKAAGTIIVLLVLYKLYRALPRIAHPVICCVAAAQLALLLFLAFG